MPETLESIVIHSTAKAVRTPCKNCVFAQYQGDTQTGCIAGRLDKFRTRGEATDAYDEDKEFSVIDRACLMHRHTASGWQGSIETAREEIRVRISPIIFLRGKSLDELKLTLKSLEKQTIQPLKVWVVLTRETPRLYVVQQALADVNLSVTIKVVMEGWERFSEAEDGRCIDLCINQFDKRKDNAWAGYVVLTAGQELPSNWIETIDVAINDDLAQFCLLQPDKLGRGPVVLTALHEYVDGNRPMNPAADVDGFTEKDVLDTVARKVEYMAVVNKEQWLIGDLEQVCPTSR